MMHTIENLIKRGYLVLAFMLMVGQGFVVAQNNPFANPTAISILPAKTPIAVGEKTTVTMVLSNNGASPIPADGAVWNISFTANIKPDLSTLNLDGGPFTVTSFEDEGVTYVQLTVSGAGIPAKTSPLVKALYTMTIEVEGIIEGGPTDMILNALPNPAIAQNLNSGDDNAVGPIKVQGVLPVTLISFTAAREGAIAQLNWATTEETNSDRFEIERSLSGKNWDKIGAVASNGESKTLKTYHFTDQNPVDGENLYRLKMIDKDLTFAYSRIQSVKFEGNPTYVYPNPVSSEMSIRGGGGKYNQVKLTNLSGQTVYQKNNVTALDKINLAGIASGIYLVSIKSADGVVSTRKIVISK